MTLPQHAAVGKIDVSRSSEFGRGQLYLALAGDMAPMTGNTPEALRRDGRSIDGN